MAPAKQADPGGFTLLEIMVVVAIIALAGQIVMVNLAALVPSTLLDSESRQLMGQIEFLRSEAQLQGKSYKLELDLDQSRYRIVLPTEERIASDQTIEESVSLGWTDMDERIMLAGFAVANGPTARSGRVPIIFDRNGFTGDQMIFLRMRSEDLEKMVWTIQLRGLDRKSRLVTDTEGLEARLPKVEEFNFK